MGQCCVLALRINEIAVRIIHRREWRVQRSIEYANDLQRQSDTTGTDMSRIHMMHIIL